MSHRDDNYIDYRKKKNNVLDAHHIAKRKLANRDLHVSFDPKDHKEFLTGFRKRKQQRRMEAQQQIKKKQKQEKSEDRAKKKSELREKLGLGDNFGIDSDSDDEKSVEMKPSSVKVYQGSDYTAVATVEEIHNSTSEEESDSDSGKAPRKNVSNKQAEKGKKSNERNLSKQGSLSAKKKIMKKKGGKFHSK